MVAIMTFAYYPVHDAMFEYGSTIRWKVNNQRFGPTDPRENNCPLLLTWFLDEVFFIEGKMRMVNFHNDEQSFYTQKSKG